MMFKTTKSPDFTLGVLSSTSLVANSAGSLLAAGIIALLVPLWGQMGHLYRWGVSSALPLLALGSYIVPTLTWCLGFVAAFCIVTGIVKRREDRLLFGTFFGGLSGIAPGLFSVYALWLGQ